MNTQGRYGIYKGISYELNMSGEEKWRLISNDENDLENGFRFIVKDRYLKDIEFSDLSYCFQKDTQSYYKDSLFDTTVIREGVAMILARGGSELVKKYGMDMYKRTFYYKRVPYSDIEYTIQTWIPYKRYIDQVSKSVVKNGLIELEGTRAIYNEREYGYIEVSKDECYIVSNNPIDIYNGFDEFEANRYRKLIMKDTVTFIFHKSSIAYYKDKQYIVKSITGNQIKLYDNDEVQEVHILDVEKIVSTWNHV